MSGGGFGLDSLLAGVQRVQPPRAASERWTAFADHLTGQYGARIVGPIAERDGTGWSVEVTVHGQTTFRYQAPSIAALIGLVQDDLHIGASR